MSLWLWALIVIGLLIVVIMSGMALRKSHAKGGAPFAVGTVVNTNPLIGEDYEDLIVLDSDNKNSIVRSQNRKVFTMENDTLMADESEVCDKRKLVRIANDGASCWLDSIMVAFMIPDAIFMYIQAAMYNMKKNDTLSQKDYDVLYGMQLYVDTLRYSARHRKLKHGTGLAFKASMLASREVVLSKENIMEAIRQNINLKEKGANGILSALFIIKFLHLNARIADVADSDPEWLKLTVEQENPDMIFIAGSVDTNGIDLLIREYLVKPVFDRYKCFSILIGKKIPKGPHTESDFIDPSKKGLFVPHQVCIVRCPRNWLYYDDNYGGIVVEIDDPLTLFRTKMGHVWIRVIMPGVSLPEDAYDLIESIGVLEGRK